MMLVIDILVSQDIFCHTYLQLWMFFFFLWHITDVDRSAFIYYIFGIQQYFLFSPFLGISEQQPTGNSPGLYMATWARKEFLFLLVHTLPLGGQLNLMRTTSQLASNQESSTDSFFFFLSSFISNTNSVSNNSSLKIVIFIVVIKQLLS